MKNYLQFLKCFSVLLLLLGITSCQKELDKIEPGQQPQSMDELTISENFDFKTEKQITLKIISEDMTGKPAASIEIFNADPDGSGEIIKSGISDREQIYETAIKIPAHLEELYIERTTFEGQTNVVPLEISGDQLEYTFHSAQNKNYKDANVIEPGCWDCSISISDSQSGSLNINNGETVCILEGGSFSGDVNFNGGTLFVCGTLNLQNLNGAGDLIVSNDGIFSTSNLNINDANMYIENYSDAFTVSGSSINNNGTFVNMGIIAVAGINNNSQGVIDNYGTLNVSSNFSNNAMVYNDGILNVEGSFTNNSGGDTENYCQMNIAGDITNNNAFTNYSYIETGGVLTLNSNSTLDMYYQALVHTADLMVNGAITTYGNDYSKLVISGQTTINSSGSVNGNTDVCDLDNIETNNGYIDPAVTYCQAVIPETYCNPGAGAGGGGSLVDSDNDGVEDEFDDYPDDPDRAFNNYYPAQDQFGSLVFEDLWPYKGDYDFNDMVVYYQYNPVTNANENVVEIYITVKVMAIGAGFVNGFGVQLGADPGDVSDVTGDFSLTQGVINLESNNVESGQDKAVVIFFDNAFDVLPHPGGGTGVNTDPGLPNVQPQELSFLVSFDYPMLEDVLGVPPYNPFIFVNSDRGREIHLKNLEPTSLVATGYFGSGQDDSDPATGRYYTTPENLPWAINLMEEFDYPIEKVPVIEAFNYFDEWAESNGALYPDWYLDQTGYRNSGNIYGD